MTSAIAAQAAVKNNFDFLTKFDVVNASAAALSESISEHNATREEYLEKIEAFITNAFEQVRISIASDRRLDNRTLRARMLEWVAYISLLLGVLSLIAAKDAPTVKDIQILSERILKQNDEIQVLMGYQKPWVTRCRAQVLSNTRAKSFVIGNIDPFTSVSIVSVKHKWVFVTYISSKDSLPRAGWVMKKYLVRIR